MQNRLSKQAGSDRGTAFSAAGRRIGDVVARMAGTAQHAAEQRAADMRQRWELSDYDAGNALHCLRGQSLVWLFAAARRWRGSSVPLQTYLLPVILALAALMLTKLIHAATFQILLAAVIISVRVGGLRAGLLSALLCFLGVGLAIRFAVQTAAPEILLAFLCFPVVSVLACVLVDSLENARREADRRRASSEAVSRRCRFLVEATAIMETEYSYDAILASVTRAIVPAFAQWATADIFLDGQFRRAAVSHCDEGAEALLRAGQRGRALSIPAGHALYETLLSRQTLVSSNVTDELIAPLALGQQDAPGLRPLHMLFVPLTARNRLLGALTLISTAPDRPFLPADIAAARDLALRVGMAIDNLRLYQGAREEADENARRARLTADQKNLLEIERAQLMAQNARLTVEATTDGLTGLLNHLTFKRALDEQFERADRESSPISLAIMDVDRFKSYNDKFGHPAGDEILRRMAAIMRETARGTDIVARYGGEEFVVVMPDTDAQGAVDAMERLRLAVQSSPWPNGAVTASFGVATVRPGGFTPVKLVAAADDALYRSKQAGRNRVTRAEVTIGPELSAEAVVHAPNRSAAAIESP